MPGTIFDGFPSYLVRYLGGDELADILDVPERRRGRRCSAARCGCSRAAPTRAGDASPVVEKAAARFSTQLLEGFGWVARGGERAPFDIPQELADRWDVRAARGL